MVFSSFQSRYPNAVDMWALGEIAHKLLTKKHVFESPYALFQFTEHSEGFPDIHLRCSNIDTLASSFIQAAMTPSPGNRLTAIDAQRHDWMLALLSPSLSVAVPSVGDTCNVPRKNFSVRKTPDKDTPSSSHLHPSDLSQHKLLSPPGSIKSTEPFDRSERS
jgi:serine/threonine protein kinase